MPNTKARQHNPSGALPFLLQTAGLLDLVIAFALFRVAARVADFPRNAWEAELALGAGVLVALWFVIEVIFQGRSFGRVAMGLELRRLDGGLPSFSANIARFIRKTTQFWTALTPGTMAPYLLREGDTWQAPFAASHSSGSGPNPATGGSGQAQGDPPNWRLSVSAGPHKGESIRLWDVPRFRSQGVLRIGADPNWADLALPSCPKVSRMHAEIRRSGNTLTVWDVGSSGRGSTNGTRVQGRRVPAGSFLKVGNADHLKVADVSLTLHT